MIKKITNTKITKKRWFPFCVQPKFFEDKVVEAVQATNSPRVTASDVAAAGGLSLSEAKSGVVSLAAALGAEADLEVSKQGRWELTHWTIFQSFG